MNKLLNIEFLPNKLKVNFSVPLSSLPPQHNRNQMLQLTSQNWTNMFKYKIEDLHKGYENTFTTFYNIPVSFLYINNESLLGCSCGRKHQTEDETPAHWRSRGQHHQVIIPAQSRQGEAQSSWTVHLQATR